MFKKNFLCILLIVFCKSHFAQNGFTTYTINTSLGSGVKISKAICTDDSGHVWIGQRTIGASTVTSLVKYNPSSGQWVKYNNNTLPAFKSNYITDIKKDGIGNLWIGCDSGLVKFDGANFINYNINDGLPSNFVKKVEISGNQIYAVTDNGLSRFDGVGFTNYNVSNGKLPFNNISALNSEDMNTIWLGGDNQIVKFNIDNSLTITSYSLYNCPINSGTINCIYTDQQNTKWIGTTNNGVLIFDGNLFENASAKYNIIGEIPSSIYSICKGVNGGVMFKIFRNVIENYNYTQNTHLIELTPSYNAYYYLAPAPTHTTAFNNLYSDGLKVYYTLNNLYHSPEVFGVFDKSSYNLPFGELSEVNYKYLDINQVKAGIGNRNNMHGFAYNDPDYEVPKNSGKYLTNSSTLWIVGTDNNGSLRGGVNLYPILNNNDFYPGPLDTISSIIDTVTSKLYDKVWKVAYTDIIDFIQNYNIGNVQNGSYTIPNDILTWPAIGSGNNSKCLAPYIDVNGDGYYNPMDGDYPKIKGDQAIYFIYNDMLATHASSFIPMGLEIHGVAYAYGCSDVLSGRNELSYTTFYDYKIINRSNNNYHDVYIGLWSDAKIGSAVDDYVGCNVQENYGYVYNADTLDENYQEQIGFGSYMPAHGTVVLKGPSANALDGLDNDNDGITDEAFEECLMSKFISIYEGESVIPSPQSWPSNKEHYNNFLKGRWKDSTNLTCGSTGYGGTISTNWLYPGDPNGLGDTDLYNTCSGNWIQTIFPQNMNYLLSSGPFDLSPGEVEEVEYAFVTSFDSTQADNPLLPLVKLKSDIQKVRAFYALANKPNCLQNITIGVNEMLDSKTVSVYPNPTKQRLTVSLSQVVSSKTNYQLVDVLGREVLKGETDKAEFTVDMENVNTGVYFLRLEQNNSIIVKKIVKD